MELKVRLFYDGKLVDPSDYPKIVISNKTIDRIVNDVYERETGIADMRSQSDYDEGFGMRMSL
jgi:hypothetical protein